LLPCETPALCASMAPVERELPDERQPDTRAVAAVGELFPGRTGRRSAAAAPAQSLRRRRGRTTTAFTGSSSRQPSHT
jgi:hypothetical protein